MTEYKEAVCRKLRETVQEFGQKSIKDAVIIGPFNYTEMGGHTYINAPTVAITTLGICDWKIARFFEDI